MAGLTKTEPFRDYKPGVLFYFEVAKTSYFGKKDDGCGPDCFNYLTYSGFYSSLGFALRLPRDWLTLVFESISSITGK